MLLDLLVSLEDYSATRGVRFDPTDKAAILALNMASEAVRSFCGRSFDLVEDEDVTLDGTGVDSLLLPSFPVVDLGDVIAISIDGSETILDPALDYRLAADAGILYRTPTAAVWLPGHQNYRTTYSHGFAEIPADVQLVVMQIASRGIQLAASGGVVLTSETLGPASFTFDVTSHGGLLATEVSVLARYRALRVG